MSITQKGFTLVIESLRKLFAKKPLEPSQVKRSRIRRILLLQVHASVEEALLGTPALRAIRQHFPDAHIVMMTSEAGARTLKNSLYVDAVFVLDAFLVQSLRKNPTALLRTLRAGFDLAVILNSKEHFILADLVAVFSRARYILGPAKPKITQSHRNFMYHLHSPYSAIQKHQVERYMDIVRHIGIQSDNLYEEMNLARKEKAKAVQFLTENDLAMDDVLIGFYLEEEGDDWPVNRFVDVAKYFSTHRNAKILSACTDEAQNRLRQFKGGLPFAPFDVNEFSEREMAAVFSFCDVVICYDSAIMHLMASVDIPTVILFGDKDPSEWKPIGREFVPLLGSGGKRSTITVEQVLEQSNALMRGFPKSGRSHLKTFDISEKALESYLETLHTFDGS